jgi:diguanylate cyclase (GGDEF)-like protein
VAGLLTSWRALACALLVGLAGVGFLVVNLEQEQSERTMQEVVTDAELISTPIIEVELPPGVDVRQLPDTAIGRLDRAVQHLISVDQLVGLQLWTREGRLVYSDSPRPDSLSDEELSRMQQVLRGTPYVAFEQDQGRQETATVLLQPHDQAGGPSGLVAEMLLPRAAVADEIQAASFRLYSGAGSLLAIVTALAIVARRRMLRREHESLHDSLTGLGNRAQLMKAGRMRLADVGRRGPMSGGPRGIALLLLDLDGFKEVNDTLGHAVGDQLLIAVARALRSAVRSDDDVVRLGGDEFAVILTELPGRDVAVRAAQSIADVLHRPFPVDRVTLEVGVSIGVAVSPEHGCDLSTLLRRADVAMYQAKHNGGGVRLYDPAEDLHDEARLDLLAQLRGAIDGGQLMLEFQPKVALRTDRTVGLEALVRWNHPELGRLAPDTFLPAAERTALMRPLTDWVLREALEQCATWRTQGWDVTVAVNIAPATLLDAEFPARVTELMATAGVPGSALTLEVTETAVMVDPDRAAQTLRRLRAMGVGVAVDDFGVGHTSLSYLKTLPLESLKIDRTFVTNLLEDDRDAAVTRAVIQLGHDLGLVVVAEGVETGAVRQRLRELGCDEVQGYLIARPLAAEDVVEWLLAYARAASGESAVVPAPR